MTKILNIESATQVCSVCVSQNNQIIALRETHKPNSHSKLLTVFIEELIQELDIRITDLDAISISLGPGSYTGLRIGASTAKGLAYGSGLPIIGLDTLQILANRILEEPEHLSDEVKESGFLLRPMIDARRMEVYTALYDKTLQTHKKVSAVVVEENSFAEELEMQNVVFFGNGADKCQEIIKHQNAVHLSNIEVSSVNMASLAIDHFKRQEFIDTAYFEPFYLKEFIATIPRNKVIPEQPRRRRSDT